ncbi:MAG: phosphoglucosamine mutase [Andreesenia angusta]|nr:phosphoglucosamine mutase [Andreesenia angusta]
MKLFGTDGVRGIANTELDPTLAYKLGKAGAYILSKGKEKAKILVGRDTRISGSMLESALIAGICSVGVDVVKLGVVPTPAVAHLVREYNADGGVVISASHNPVEYNGIKFLNEKGYKLTDEMEESIEKLIEDGVENLPSPVGNDIGNAYDDKNSIEEYVKYVSNIYDIDLKGMKIALDCSNGANYISAPKLFKDLNAEVLVINDKPDGYNINKDCGSTHLESIKKFTVDNNCDIGFAYDGDADRCLAIDDKGNEIDGDFIMTILANHLKNNNELEKDTLVVTVMSNMGLFISCKENDIKLEQTKVGDRYVLENMLSNGYKIGGEQSGHIILLDYNTTGDGLITSLSLAKTVKEMNKPLSEIKDIMKKLPQVLVNVRVERDKKNIYEVNDKVIDKIKSVEKSLEGKGRVLIRPSGTEPLIRVMLEGEDNEYIEKMANEIASLIEKEAN